MYQSPPLRLQLWEVLHGAVVIPEEIHPVDGVAAIQLPIDLADGVIHRNGIREAVNDRGGPLRVSTVVNRKAGALAADWWPQGAACNLQTGRAGLNAHALQRGYCVRNAVRWVPAE